MVAVFELAVGDGGLPEAATDVRIGGPGRGRRTGPLWKCLPHRGFLGPTGPNAPAGRENRPNVAHGVHIHHAGRPSRDADGRKMAKEKRKTALLRPAGI